MKSFVFTCGDTNGIGPEIVLKTLNAIHARKNRIIFVIPKIVFSKISKIVKAEFEYDVVSNPVEIYDTSSNVILYDIPGGKISPGKSTKSSGRVSFNSLNVAIDLLKNDLAEGLITAPISKEAWALASIDYKGHTDFLGDSFGIHDQVMMFYAKNMMAALTTVHIPLNKVTPYLTTQKISSVIKVVNESLRFDFGVDEPKIAVLGLNPHAGEEGHLGAEEQIVIGPAIKNSRLKNIEGPFVPDAFFGKKLYKEFDVVIGMYHDQVLIPFKLLNFDRGVNFTAGLPIVRTSPDHGTAFDIAYKGIADNKSLFESFKVADKIVRNRTKNRR